MDIMKFIANLVTFGKSEETYKFIEENEKILDENEKFTDEAEKEIERYDELIYGKHNELIK